MLIFDSVNPQKNETYSSLAKWTFESRNGEKTVSVRVFDRAGNESNTVTATVNLTDQKTQVSGVLSDADLVWTKKNSPYYVVENIMVEDGKTLKIEPGVDVQFSGNHYIHVNGKLSAVGTENERIKFYGVESGTNNWQGMKFGNDRDSILSYVDIDGITNGINGYCDIDHANITANGWAIGSKTSNSYTVENSMTGSLLDSTVSGNVAIQDGKVLRSDIYGDSIFLYQGFVIDNTINGNTTIESLNVDGNKFIGNKLSTKNSFVFNNEVSTTSVESIGDIQMYGTYTGCNIAIGNQSDNLISVLSEIQFNNCTFSRFISSVNNSNFMNCGVISVTSKAAERKELDAQGNYWGDVNTEELKNKEITGDKNVSFINDYNDGYFDLSKVDYSDYKDIPIYDIGYKEGREREVVSTVIYKIGDTGPAGGLVFYDKGFYSDGWRYLEAAPSNIGNLRVGYYRPDGEHNNVDGTACAIGAGKYNTDRLVKFMNLADNKAYSERSGEAVAEYAARKCFDYSYGGCDDWFLPSRDELDLMCWNLYMKGLGSFNIVFDYWSSSEDDSDVSWKKNFRYGNIQLGSYRNYDYSVRAVRAF